jgi:1-deoxy-D-xylulose-5-phosphate synthase
MAHYPLLERIFYPDDLKKLTPEELIQVCHELREFIIDIVCENPGHLGANLGTVELTVALHYVFDVPHDKIIWDVGHQAYGHKILTGRREVFHTNRKYGGISGFPRRDESPYDVFGTGHSSTSISAALGIAMGLRYNSRDEANVIAVIGDGSLTGGMAFEGLNNAGTLHPNMLVILNDNNMSIDPNVGALKDYLLDITTSKTYNRFRDEMWDMLGKLGRMAPFARQYVQKIEASLKALFLKQSNLFEALNFRYFGPVDGHDVVHLTEVLQDLKTIKGPKLLHVLTKKGKGFPRAEENQTAFHSPGRFDRKTGEFLSAKGTEEEPPRYQDVFGLTLLELMEQNSKVIGITPAMPTGCSMNIAMEQFPDRVYDVGIAEQHAVTFSAGLATQGLIPFCNIYSSFMQRAYDQVIHDVAIQNLPVVLCLDRAGLVGDDGATHHGAFDLAYLRCIPNVIVAAPMDEIELRNLMYTAQLQPQGPFAIRYPRGKGVHAHWRGAFQEIPIGKGRIIEEAEGLAVLSLGHPGNFVRKAARKLSEEGIHFSHYDLRFLKPLDKELLRHIFQRHKRIITVEDGVLAGGFGSAVLEFMADEGITAQVIRLGIPDRFIEHGTQPELWKECGYDADSIAAVIKKMLIGKILQKVS